MLKLYFILSEHEQFLARFIKINAENTNHAIRYMPKVEEMLGIYFQKH